MKRLLSQMSVVCLVATALAAGVANGQSHGAIVAWGRNDEDQCNVPVPNGDFVAVAAGALHSLGVKTDGTIVTWGDNLFGQCNVPSLNADFVAVAGGK